ncbi:hypothetical protein KIPB_000501 [Kipferlia bialata]|uniref:Uncharacterized protein n=1 Tax=Kipferlia bialata TaxID=797122 RepID=A0A9K3CNJ2_9EUKA|nr:hypothetical protein KIPB_000501 [Kipferlia bialata]|eukprot:g501.t1
MSSGSPGGVAFPLSGVLDAFVSRSTRYDPPRLISAVERYVDTFEGLWVSELGLYAKTLAAARLSFVNRVTIAQPKPYAATSLLAGIPPVLRGSVTALLPEETPVLTVAPLDRQEVVALSRVGHARIRIYTSTLASEARQAVDAHRHTSASVQMLKQEAVNATQISAMVADTPEVYSDDVNGDPQGEGERETAEGEGETVGAEGVVVAPQVLTQQGVLSQ